MVWWLVTQLILIFLQIKQSLLGGNTSSILIFSLPILLWCGIFGIIIFLQQIIFVRLVFSLLPAATFLVIFLNQLLISCDFSSSLWKTVFDSFNLHVQALYCESFLLQDFDLQFSAQVLYGLQLFSLWFGQFGILEIASFFKIKKQFEKRSLIFIWRSVNEVKFFI